MDHKNVSPIQKDHQCIQVIDLENIGNRRQNSYKTRDSITDNNSDNYEILDTDTKKYESDEHDSDSKSTEEKKDEVAKKNHEDDKHMMIAACFPGKKNDENHSHMVIAACALFILVITIVYFSCHLTEGPDIKNVISNEIAEMPKEMLEAFEEKKKTFLQMLEKDKVEERNCEKEAKKLFDQLQEEYPKNEIIKANQENIEEFHDMLARRQIMFFKVKQSIVDSCLQFISDKKKEKKKKDEEELEREKKEGKEQQEQEKHKKEISAANAKDRIKVTHHGFNIDREGVEEKLNVGDIFTVIEANDEEIKVTRNDTLDIEDSQEEELIIKSEDYDKIKLIPFYTNGEIVCVQYAGHDWDIGRVEQNIHPLKIYNYDKRAIFEREIDQVKKLLEHYKDEFRKKYDHGSQELRDAVQKVANDNDEDDQNWEYIKKELVEIGNEFGAQKKEVNDHKQKFEEELQNYKKYIKASDEFKTLKKN